MKITVKEARVILRWMRDDAEVELNFLDDVEVEPVDKPIKPLTEGEMANLPMWAADPCPNCRKGVVCRTPMCGRLKLPNNHPARSTKLRDWLDVTDKIM